MSCRTVVLRPEPGAAATVERARAIGLDAIASPLFMVEPLEWEAPDPERFDALLLTSGNAARQAGAQLGRYMDLPCYAVGSATAAAARKAGLGPVATGTGGATEMVERLRADGRHAILHLAGADHRPFDETGLSVTRRAVYAARAIGNDARLGICLELPAIILIHSPRAATLLDRLVPDRAARARHRLVAISRAALLPAGIGWAGTRVAEKPDDDAMLACARRLCDEAHKR